jgi:plasmid stabilization system protein ParE
MRYTVHFHIEAQREMLDAAEFIAEQGSSQAAMRWYAGIEAAIASLASMPRRCARARESVLIPGVELRQLVFKSHRIIFTIRGRHVHVLHVRHAAQAHAQTPPEASPEP